MKIGGRMLVHLFFALSLLALNLPLGFASLQSPTATLNGRVVDPNKALVTGAKVEATNEDTNVTTFTETGSDGWFVLANLPTGRYRVTVQKEGFQTIVKPDVDLHVQDQVSLNFTMDVGSVVQSLTIVGGAPLVQTESATVGTLVDRQFVANLPLNGRSFQSLIALTPGVTLTKATPAEQGQFSTNGQRPDSNYFTVDGVSANIGSSPNSGSPGQAAAGSLPGLGASGGTNNIASIDALQEFKILTSAYAPEFGRTPGAQIAIVTRSGANDLHGSLFDYLRNDVFDATDTFAKSQALRKPPLRQNDFGGVLGGPILKDRTFFFVSYEGQRLRLPLVGITDVPSLTARQLAPAQLKPFLDAFPLPTGPNRVGPTGLPTGFTEFSSSFSNSSKLDAASIRVDQTIKNRVTLFARYNYAPSSIEERGPVGLRSLNSLATLDVGTQTFTLGLRLAASPRIINDMRFNYSRNTTDVTLILDDFGGATVPPESLLFPPFSSSQNSSFFFLVGGGSLALNAGRSLGNVQRQINGIDSLSMIIASHQLKVGIDCRVLTPTISVSGYAQSASFFGGIGITNPGVSPPLGSILSGKASLVQITAQSAPREPIVKNVSLYAQDTWKVNTHLMVTYGLRYEVNPSPGEANGNKPYSLMLVDDPSKLAFAQRGTPLYKTTYRNFAPRVGIAYSLSESPGHETVLRGGFGIFYDLGLGSLLNAFGSSFPFIGTRNLLSAAFPLDQTLATPPLVKSSPPVTGQIFIADPRLKLPYTYQWNVAIERSLGASQAVSVSYVGAAGRRLLRQDLIGGSILSANPNFAPSSSILLTRNTATSDYDAMQVQFHRRLSRGLQALASYTWSHSIDIASSDSASFPTPSTQIDPQIDRGPSDFDVRHTLEAAITYEIPTPRLEGIGNHILRNWGVDTLFTARSATPVNVTVTRTTSFGSSISLRPDLVPGVPLYISNAGIPGGRQINNTPVVGNPRQIGPFFLPQDVRQGNLGRNAFRGFPENQIDLGIRRQFSLGEARNIQFKVEFFNLLNHPNFGNPSGSLGTVSSTTGLLTNPNSLFGRSTSTLASSLGSGGQVGGFSPLYQIGGPRSVQLSLKLRF
jgi:hypothetical protein